MESIDKSVNNFFDNPIVLGVVAIFITMYGPRLSPKLPDFVRDAFNNSVFRFIIMVLVIFSGLKDIKLALIISILFVGIMSIVNTQNIKEDYHNQVQEYYANYNLFGSNQTEHFEDFHENYASQTENPTQLNDPNQKVSLANPQQNTQVNDKKKNKKVVDDEEDEDDESAEKAMNELSKAEKELDNVINELDEDNSNKLKKHTDSRVAKYIDTAIGVLDDMDKYAKTPGSGVSEDCQNSIKIPTKKCINQIKSKISDQNLSEITKNRITRKFDQTKWLDN
jgi:hypothetical protein